MLSALLLSTLARPNIVYIMADDLGYRELGFMGQKKIPTPHLDRLAREGVIMTRAYAGSPVCAPTRYSLLTGKHQGHAVIRGNKEQGGFGPNDKEGQTPIQASETLLSEVLQKAGYRTGIVGKWALGGTDKGQSPLDHGFESFYGYLCQRRAHNFYPAYLWRDRDPDLLGNPVFGAHQKIETPLDEEAEYYRRYTGPTFSAERLMSECVKFVDKADNRPFFLYYAPTLPHVALQAPKEWVDKFPRDWDTAPYLGQNGYLPCARPRATYAAMIAYLDHTVGQIMNALDSTGRAKNTLIIFTSDNGAVAGAGGADPKFFQSNGELRAGKMSLYEGGIRVPFVARWPGQISPGTSSGSSITCYDAMSTLCAAAGVKAPKNDGSSYLPALTGKPQPARPFLYFEYPEASAMQVVMMGDWKAIRPDLKKNKDKVELYDLANDLSETRDLANQRPDLVRRALEIMNREHRPNPDFPLGLVDSAQR